MTKEQLGNLIIASEDTMYHVAKTLLHSDADCADAIQEAIVKAFASFETLRKDAYAKTWLVRIVINECYAIMRREKKFVPLEDYSVVEEAAERTDYTDLYRALSHLAEEIRLTVTLYYMEGYSVREIAALMAGSRPCRSQRTSESR